MPTDEPANPAPPGAALPAPTPPGASSPATAPPPVAGGADAARAIRVRGARVHNLAGVDADIPRGALVVVTGPSGSGKSSLAFDTIYAEGQRRYVESLSVHARQLLDKLGKPDVDAIDGLSPAIAIEQRQVVRSPRSTVGTVTEINDHLRLLYARVGRVYCYQCGREIRAWTVPEIVDAALALPERTRFVVVAPVVRGQRGKLAKTLDALRRDGYTRVAIDGALVDLSSFDSAGSLRPRLRSSPAESGHGPPALDPAAVHTVDVHVDRLIAKPGIRARLTDSVELALRLAGGLVRLATVPAPGPAAAPDDSATSPSTPPGGGDTATYSEQFACPDCDITYPPLEPRALSFNSPHGACPGCDGLGVTRHLDPARIVPDPRLSLREGAIAPWTGRSAALYQAILADVCRHFGIDMHAPWQDLPDAHRDILLGGSPEPVAFDIQHGRRRSRYDKPFEGVIGQLERRLAERERDPAGGDDAYHDLARYHSERVCADCGGARLRREARHVKVGGLALPELSALPLSEARTRLAGLALTDRERAIAGRLLSEIDHRLAFLVGVGLGYLSLDRAAATLSGGESQRIRLATQIGAALVGVLYVLDEPSIGLHPRDTGRLLDALRALRDRGNTVLVVEHDEDAIRAADWVIDLGPGAGPHGGRVVAAGPPAAIAASGSLTGDYLSGRRTVGARPRRRVDATGGARAIVVAGARANNLAGVTAAFPVGALTCVTGVSGSGKSTLVMDTLLPALAARLGRGEAAFGVAGAHDELRGAHLVDRVLAVDQAPIGRTPRSSPATYTGALGQIRDIFAQLPESKVRGYKPGRYSFNVKGGRCETCQGDGALRIEMSFLPDVYVTCDACGGRRYNRETLEVKYRGMSIADVLELPVAEAIGVFESFSALRARLEAIRDVGLGYLALGQPATTLSGGEAQRLKLARELARPGAGRTVYVLDEPTTGLHFDDIRTLMDVLSLLVEQGNTAIVIEHNLDVIARADHVIDLGPEGGAAGGRVVATGTPEDVAACAGSHTGQHLRRALARLGG